MRDNKVSSSRNTILTLVAQRKEIEQTRKTQEQIISNLCALSLAGLCPASAVDFCVIKPVLLRQAQDKFACRKVSVLNVSHIFLCGLCIIWSILLPALAGSSAVNSSHGEPLVPIAGSAGRRKALRQTSVSDSANVGDPCLDFSQLASA
jgi:hypothetical protein